LAIDYINYLEKSSELKKVSHNAWKVNFFANPVVNKVETAGKD
jgi:hypothetical protein